MGLIMLTGVLAVIGQVAAGGMLDQTVAVQWRGVAFGAAVEELAGRCDVPYIYDASVTPAVLDETIRMNAERLTGRQAFMWLARMAGLEAVEREGAILVAEVDRLPVAWRLAMGSAAVRSRRNVLVGGGEPGEQQGTGDGGTEPMFDVEWVDAPLSRVGEDVRRWFGIDFLAAACVVEDQPLVRLSAAGVTMTDIVRHLSAELDVEVVERDGALAAGFGGTGGLDR